jgi:hypothetical protein
MTRAASWAIGSLCLASLAAGCSSGRGLNGVPDEFGLVLMQAAVRDQAATFAVPRFATATLLLRGTNRSDHEAMSVQVFDGLIEWKEPGHDPAVFAPTEDPTDPQAVAPEHQESMTFHGLVDKPGGCPDAGTTPVVLSKAVEVSIHVGVADRPVELLTVDADYVCAFGADS